MLKIFPSQNVYCRLFIICLITISLYFSFATDIVDIIDGSPSNEFRGYYKREHSLVKPYQGLRIFKNNFV
jgi:hypothetical protein